MKYWVYKESRILGPFDKEAVSGLPGLDGGTLVCAGDPDRGGWIPASEVEGLGSFASAPPSFDPMPGSLGLLDGLEIEAGTWIGGEGSLADDLFQDAALKKGFSDALGAPVADEAELRRSKDKVVELTVHLETMYRRISELEASHTDLARRLAEKELELKRQPPAPAPFASAPPQSSIPSIPAAGVAPPASDIPFANRMPPAPSVPQPPLFSAAAPPPPAAPAVPPGPATPQPPLFSSPPPPAPAAEWPAVPDAGALPSIPSLTPDFSSVAPPPAALPPMPAFTPPAPVDAAPPPPAPVAKPPTLSFGKPKHFKVVPTIKAFKVIAPGAIPPPAAAPVPVPAPAPVPETPAFTIPPPSAAAPPSSPPPPLVADANLAPTVVGGVPPPLVVDAAPPVFGLQPPPASAPAVPANPTPAPLIPPAPEFGLLDPLSGGPATPAPAGPPPNTLSMGAPVTDMAGAVDDAAAPPPATMAVSGGGWGAAVPMPAMSAVAPDVASRFAKPPEAPPTEQKKSTRNNKPFLIGGAIFVVILGVVGFIFMRQPKDEMKQMAQLDDGRGKIGVPALDEGSSAPPMAKPRPMTAAPAPAPVQAPPPGPSPEHKAAIDMVKDFPLDGGRGTVGKWLQYSYTASPGAGAEEWNASTTADKTILVEYRVAAGPSGNGAMYLFEADVQRGFVTGKNLEARQMLAGTPPADEPEIKRPKKKAAAPKPKKKARPKIEEPREVPLLPLPDSGELRPPAEDDGAFGSDTVNQGL